jgi:hypothetical protein
MSSHKRTNAFLPINGDRFSRRALLKRMGVSGALLPLIFAERPAGAQQGGNVKRLFAMAFGNGVRPNFYPAGNDLSAPFGKSIEPLTPFKTKMIMPIGLDYKHILDDGYKYDGHFTYCATLTGTREKKSESRRATAPSIDQMISDDIAKRVSLKVPLLTLGIRSTGDGCSISWRSAGVQNPASQQAAPVFTKLFSGVNPGGGAVMPPAMVDLTLQRRKSVLDYLGKELTAFQARLGTEDRQKIEQHTVSLRDLEKRLVTPTTGGGGANCAKPAMGGTDAEANGRAMYDIVAMAFRCDLTRVATVSISDDGGGDGTSFPWVGSRGDFHAVAHASNDAQMTAICNWFMTLLANLAKQLEETPEPGGTALDNSVLVSFSNMDEGNSHYNGKIPIVMLGSAGGYFKTNQVIRAPKEAHNKLLTSLCRAMGLNVTGIGAAQYAGELAGLAR